MKETVLPILNNRIASSIEGFPVYVPLVKDIIMDYSLISNPYIENKLLILNIDGKVVRKGDPNDKIDFPLNSSILPHITEASKGIKILISPFTINTALYALYYNSMLHYKLEIPNIIDIIGEKKGLLNILSAKNTLRRVLKSKFGEKKKGLWEFSIEKCPKISLENQVFSSTFDLLISFSTDSSEGIFQIFTGFRVNLSVNAKAGVKEEGKISIALDDIKINHFETAYNNSGLNLEDSIIRTIINWGLELGKNSINSGMLSNLQYRPPNIAGMNFLNSVATIQNDYIEFDLGVKFLTQSKRRFMKKRKFYRRK